MGHLKLDRLDYINIGLLLLVIIMSGAIIAKLIATIDADKVQRAEQDTRKIIARDAFIASNDFTANVFDSLAARCKNSAKYGEAGLNICSGFNSYSVSYRGARDFLAKYNDAVSLRLTSNDYPAIEAAYRTIVTPNLKDMGREWTSRIYEGIAYAEMKQGKFTDAKQMAGEAVKLDPYSEFAGATSIKLACVQSRPATEVQAAYDNLQTRLKDRQNETIGLKDAKLLQRNSRLERTYLENDTELYSMCSHAGLKPH